MTAAVLAVPHGLSPGSGWGQQAAGSERSPKTLPEFGSFKIQEKGRGGCPSASGYREHSPAGAGRAGSHLLLLPTSKTNAQLPDRAGLREMSRYSLSLPRQKVEQQAHPPVNPLPSGDRQELVPAARDLSGAKMSLAPVNPPPGTASGRPVLLGIDLFRFIQNNQECPFVSSRRCGGL